MAGRVTNHTAGVIAPPPLIALAAVVIGAALDWLAPAYILTVLLDMADRVVFGFLLIAIGCTLAILGKINFDRAGTQVNPFKPTSAMVTTGVYAYLRNPMYVGLAFIVGGIAVALASDWTLVMLAGAALVVHFGVVKREERYMTAKFGDDYLAYRKKVSRYGWPF